MCCLQATKLYCFVHKVPVCGECICFPEHQICVVRSNRSLYMIACICHVAYLMIFLCPLVVTVELNFVGSYILRVGNWRGVRLAHKVLSLSSCARRRWWWFSNDTAGLLAYVIPHLRTMEHLLVLKVGKCWN